MEADPVFWDAVARLLSILLHDFFFIYFPGPGKRRVQKIHRESP
jgi:hypothetical protein